MAGSERRIKPDPRALLVKMPMQASVSPLGMPPAAHAQRATPAVLPCARLHFSRPLRQRPCAQRSSRWGAHAQGLQSRSEWCWRSRAATFASCFSLAWLRASSAPAALACSLSQQSRCSKCQCAMYALHTPEAPRLIALAPWMERVCDCSFTVATKLIYTSSYTIG